MAPLRRSRAELSRFSRAAGVALGLLATLPPLRAAAATANQGPLIVEARLLWVEGAADEDAGDDLIGLEITGVRYGFTGGSILVATAPRSQDGCGGGSREALRAAAIEGWTLELVLVPAPRGEWAIDCARRTSPSEAAAFGFDEPGVATPPLVVTPEAELFDRPSQRRRIGSAASTPSFEQEVVRLVNVLRQDNGNLPPLKQQSLLESAAETHSQNMATRDFFAHCDLDTGDSPWDRIAAAGYSGYSNLGENIGAGYQTPSEAVAAWNASAPHRANMLSPNFRELGAGYAADPGDAANVRRDFDGNCVADSFGNGPWGTYWTQNFGSRYFEFPLIIEREAHSTTSPSVQLYLYGSFPDGTQWAEQMRFSNDNATWSPWESYQPNKTWTLSAGNGLKTVWAQVRNGATTYTSSDTIELDGDCPVITIEDDVLFGTQSFESCEIHAGPALHVAGDVSLRASLTVLRSGFSVGAGAELTIGPMP
ncbi:MAG TPA: CAP domain-containing protein [Thermoanaerobaculia bacterium]|nr:CAP domain-containing protein [Thermoanaerobaculia bacterium]